MATDSFELWAAALCLLLVVLTGVWIGIIESGHPPRRLRHVPCPHCGSAGDGHSRGTFRRISDPFSLERERYHCAIVIPGHYLQCRVCSQVFFATDRNPFQEGVATPAGQRELVPVDFATVQQAVLEKRAYNRKMAFWLAQPFLVASVVYGVAFACGVSPMDWAVAAALIFALLVRPSPR